MKNGWRAGIWIGVMATLVWQSNASAAIGKADTAMAERARTASEHYNECQDKLANLFLAGTFIMPGSGENMNLWVGRPRMSNKENEVWGVLGKTSGGLCEATCKVTRFERFQKDLKPALMEFDCEGSRINTLRMPLQVQWTRDKSGFETTVRLGSSIYQVEQAPLRVHVNRYAVAGK